MHSSPKMKPSDWPRLMAETVRVAIAAAAARFDFSHTPRLDAELLMAQALGVSREVLLLSRLDDPQPLGFAMLVERRAAGEPIAYITGTRDFWTLTLLVGPGALIPRPDSETLIEAAIEHFGARAPNVILDLGTGPGTLLLAALSVWPEARGVGVDAAPDALRYAEQNARTLGYEDRVRFALGNWADGLNGRFDLVLINPPYIGTNELLPAEVRDHEPAAALFAGADGLDDYRVLAAQLPRLMAPGGVAVIEIGATQAEAVGAMLVEQQLAVAIRRDLAGLDRCLVVTS